MNFQTTRGLIFLWLLFGFFAFAASPETDFEKQSEKVPWPCYKLTAENFWMLNSPDGERFDASSLLLRKNGELWTANDYNFQICRIEFSQRQHEADLIVLTNLFPASQLALFEREKIGRWDVEGLAQDSIHRVYICEEANRWIFRFDPKSNLLERIDIDWAPVHKFFHKSDINASFEGTAVGKGKLFVANERQQGRIFVVHLQTRKIIDHFTVRPSRTVAKDIHYSDLCWFEDSLWALLRENSVVVKIDPTTKRIVAEFNYRELEQGPEVAYKKTSPTSSMEGLAVSEHYIWLVSDNNGFARKRDANDTRPILFRAARPDK